MSTLWFWFLNITHGGQLFIVDVCAGAYTFRSSESDDYDVLEQNIYSNQSFPVAHNGE